MVCAGNPRKTSRFAVSGHHRGRSKSYGCADARGWRCSRSSRCFGSSTVHGRNKAIAFADDSLDELRLCALFVEGGTNFPNRIVDAAFGVEIDVVAPHALNDLFPRHEVSPLFRKQDEEFQRFAFEPNAVTGATQLELSGVELKVLET